MLNTAQQRALLTEKRDRYLALAFDASAEIAAVTAQTHGISKHERAAAISQYTDKAANCAAAAEAIDAMLSALPDDSAAAPPEAP